MWLFKYLSIYRIFYNYVGVVIIMGAKERQLIFVRESGPRTPVNEFGKGLLTQVLTDMQPVGVWLGCPPRSETNRVYVMPVFEGDSFEFSTLPSVPRPEAFGGRKGQEYYIARSGEHHPHYLLVGMGKRGELTAEDMRTAVGKGVRKAEELHESSVTVHLPGEDRGIGLPVLAQAAAEAAVLASYRFHLKSEDKKGRVKDVVLYWPDRSEARADMAREIERGIQRGVIMASGQNVARVVGGMRSNIATPEAVAQATGILAERAGIDYGVRWEKHLDALGMGGMVNVGKGSENRPCMIELRYRPPGPAEGRKKIVLVGKGITFDSGGINIKAVPEAHIEEMYMDKCGAGAVLGAMLSLATLKPDAEVIGLMMMAENMPSGTSQRPGDVIRMYSGHSVEVGNTDAEGRLVLADGLAYGLGLDPDALISIATLTGAVIVGLGNEKAGLFSENDALANLLLAASKGTGESLWRMPCTSEYDRHLKSEIADLKNIGPKQGGAVTAARFLASFAEGANAFAHIDIAGPGMEKGETPYLDKALAPGFGARLLTEAILRLVES